MSEAAGKTSATISEALESTAQSTRQTRDEPAAVVEALRADSLRKSYRGRCVVDNVSVTVSPGEVVGLLGPNGAGKTTTFYMIVGLESPDSGRISLGAQDVTRWPMHRRARRGVSYLPQEPSIFRKLTVEENLLAILETLSISRAERQSRMESLLEEFHLNRVRQSKGYALSGGERRRTEIARCLTIEPKFILLDEPFAGIDPIAIDEIQRLILRLRDRRIGILITDHNVREALTITDRAYIINDGQIFRTGTPLELTNDPEVRRVYLGEKFKM